MRRIIAAILVTCGIIAIAAFLSACGHSSQPTVKPSQPPMASVIADRLNCVDVESMQPTLYAYDEVTGTCDGYPADIATFMTNDLRDRWVKVAEQFGKPAVTGDRFAIIDNG